MPADDRRPRRGSSRLFADPAVGDSVRRVWYSSWFGSLAGLGRDLRIGMRSLRRTKALSITVVVTLALGIGANAAIFSVVRGVLLETDASGEGRAQA